MEICCLETKYTDKETHVTCTGTRHITTFRSTTDRIYDGGPIVYYILYIILHYILYIILYYNPTVLQLPTVFSTVTCCTGL